MSEQPRVVRLTPDEAKSVVDEVRRARRIKSSVAVALIALGALLLAAAVGFLVGNVWASCAIIGLVVLTIGVLLGTNG